MLETQRFSSNIYVLLQKKKVSDDLKHIRLMKYLQAVVKYCTPNGNAFHNAVHIMRMTYVKFNGYTRNSMHKVRTDKAGYDVIAVLAYIIIK